MLYLAGSPDGKSIVTGAGDESLRFWNVFPGPKNRFVVWMMCELCFLTEVMVAT